MAEYPLLETDENGRFSIGFDNVPDGYRVCAHPGRTGGFLPLAKTAEEVSSKADKLTCIKDRRFARKLLRN